MSNNNKICAVFKIHPEIKSVYLFGSRATGKVVKNSDYDFSLFKKDIIKYLKKKY